MYRRFLMGILVAVGFCLSGSFAHAQEIIHSFDVHAQLQRDRTAVIEESIVYDFGDEEHHGIFRIIPELYSRDGGRYSVRLNIQGVQMDGMLVPYTVQRDGKYVNVKIGDADTVVTGMHTYLIRYQTMRSLNDFPDYTEWYWNVTGNDWLVTIERASLRVESPASSDRQRCFVGMLGSQEGSCVLSEAGNMMTVSSTRMLAAGEGLTVVLAFPASAFIRLSPLQTAWQFFRDNIWLALPLLTFLIMAYIWRKWGREPQGQGTIVPQYEEPRSLPPGLQVALLEQRFSSRAVTATILDLARRGYLKVQWDEKNEITFVKGGKMDTGFHEFERTVYQGLFGAGDVMVKPKDLQKTFPMVLQQVRTQAFAELRANKWFGRDPGQVRAAWIVGAVALLFVVIFIPDQTPIQVVSGVMSAVIMVAFGWQMPRMTKEGARVAEEVRGFKWFLSVTEEKRLAFSDAPVRKPEQFARFLPMAVAFGVEKQWAKQFTGMMVPQPSYVSGAWNGWSALQMANAVDGMHHSTVSSMYRAPSSAGSGGSGFSGGGSGGGFGGGGGGSW